MRIAVDTGGTFTDLVLEKNTSLQMFKTSTTPKDPIEGILDAVDMAAKGNNLSIEQLLAKTDTFIHGTTHAINAVITGNIAKTAFLITQGHPDVLVWREGGRIEPFDYTVPFPKPYVPRAQTFEIPERITWNGNVVTPLDETRVLEIIELLKAQGIESVAVCLLWSTVNSVHEKKIGELLETHLPGVPYTLSHILNPILREYRRASSSAIDASIKPLMAQYLGGLQKRLTTSGFVGRLLMLTSKGGVMDIEELAGAPIHAIGSGPSMAPIAGKHFSQKDAQNDTAIIVDTGGTTCDVSLVRRGVIPISQDTWIGLPTRGHFVGLPSVDVKSVGAGGGSIAWVDDGGLLHVGPKSAGAVPGPACYGLGGEHPTVTDASLILGYIDSEYFLGGKMKLDFGKAQKALETDVAKPLGIDLYEAASAVLRIATENMVSAIEQITIQQGMDPRKAILVGAGGAAGLNAVAIARQLGCETIVFPEVVAALSAFGALISDLHAEYRCFSYTTTEHFQYGAINTILKNLQADCHAFINGPGGSAENSKIELFVSARYKNQVWEIEVPVRVDQFNGPEDIDIVRQDFDGVHKELFAFCDPGSPVEFVSWRATARCPIAHDEVGRLDNSGILKGDTFARRQAYFIGIGITDARVMLLDRMDTGEKITGPAIIESPFTTIVVEPQYSAVRTESGSVVVHSS